MARFRFCFTVFRQAFLRTTSPSPAVTPLLPGELAGVSPTERLYYMTRFRFVSYFPHTITYYTPPVPQTDRLHPRFSRGYNK